MSRKAMILLYPEKNTETFSSFSNHTDCQRSLVKFVSHNHHIKMDKTLWTYGKRDENEKIIWVNRVIKVTSSGHYYSMSKK